MNSITPTEKENNIPLWKFINCRATLQNQWKYSGVYFVTDDLADSHHLPYRCDAGCSGLFDFTNS